VKVHRYMTCGVVTTSISGCDVCTACLVLCDASCTLHGTQYTAWNTCCHNAAFHITMYFY